MTTKKKKQNRSPSAAFVATFSLGVLAAGCGGPTYTNPPHPDNQPDNNVDGGAITPSNPPAPTATPAPAPTTSAAPNLK